jgi:hypothetical protein
MVSFPEDVEIRGGSLIVKERGELGPPHGSQVRVRIRPEDDTVAIFDREGKQALRFNSSVALLEVGGKPKQGEEFGRGIEGDIHVYDGTGTLRIRIGGDEGIRVHNAEGDQRIRIGGESGGIRVRDEAGHVRIYMDGEGRAAIKPSNKTLAVEFEIDETPIPTAGSVMVISDRDKVQRCGAGGSDDQHDRRLAGVLTEDPGIILDHSPSSSGRRPIAMAGKVMCKVVVDDDLDAEPIKIGDLLVTSTRRGRAQRANVAFPGAIVGKALEAFDGPGNRNILILLMLN